MQPHRSAIPKTEWSSPGSRTSTITIPCSLHPTHMFRLSLLVLIILALTTTALSGCSSEPETPLPELDAGVEETPADADTAQDSEAAPDDDAEVGADACDTSDTSDTSSPPDASQPDAADSDTSECNPHETECSSVCVDLMTSTEHCGQCNHACPDFHQCIEGACAQPSCPPGLEYCDGSCVDVQSTSAHCGGCRLSCEAGQYCSMGTCWPEGCPEGFADCNGDCVNLITDSNNCGGCGQTCHQGQICTDGRCSSEDCGPGEVSCDDGICTNLAYDQMNCGECHHQCLPGEICQDALCVSLCAEWLTLCGDACVDTRTNPLHCGFCVNPCNDEEVCNNGVCEPLCAQGLSWCDAQCVALGSDINHCGQCFNRCGAGDSDTGADYECISGQCVPVNVTIHLQAVNITAETVELTVGEEYTSTVLFTPPDATDKSTIWSSSNPTVAEVNATEGTITGISPGSAQITVTSRDGNHTDTCTVIVRVPVTGISISSAWLTLEPSGTATLTATVYPPDATIQTVEWISSDPTVATVSATGVVAVGASTGMTTITVTSDDGGFTATCQVSVAIVTIPATGVRLDLTSANLIAGEQLQLAATITPANASNKATLWLSGNQSVVTVDSTGKLTAVSGGTTMVSVTTIDGGHTATCTVTVTVPVTGLSLNAETLKLNHNQTFAMVATIYPEQATDKQVNWSSSDQTVATVSSTGVVRMVAHGGTALITATTRDGNFTAQCSVIFWVPVTGIVVMPSSATMATGESITLGHLVSPPDASNPAVLWRSGNTNIATVNSSGRVTGVSPGQTSVMVISTDSFKTATCMVLVKVPVSGVILSPSTLTLVQAQTPTGIITATIIPSEATETEVLWSSNNIAVATVTPSGNPGKATVEAGPSTGTAMITVTTVDGAYTAQALVTVSSPPRQSCKEHLQAAPGSASGIYTIYPPGPQQTSMEVYCDMTSDGGGWTLVLNNGPYQATPPKPTMLELINDVNYTGTFGTDLTQFDLFLGLRYWILLGNELRLIQGASPSSSSHKTTYRFSLNTYDNYALNLTDEQILVSTGGSPSPGMYTYHNGRPMTTWDVDNDMNLGNCASYYGNTAWWYGTCWSGSFWGGGDGGGYMNSPYWNNSGNEYFSWGSIWVR